MATMQDSIESACRLLAKLQLPDNVLPVTVERRVKELVEYTREQASGGASTSEILGEMRRGTQAEAAKMNDRREQDRAMTVRAKNLAEMKKRRRRRKV